MLPEMATVSTTSGGRRTLPRIERVRRGWVFRDAQGAGWWVDDTVAATGAQRVVAAGDPGAQCRVFTPMVNPHSTARRVYRFEPGDDHEVSLATIAAQHLRAAEDRA
jgi:hypothetical protein